MQLDSHRRHPSFAVNNYTDPVAVTTSTTEVVTTTSTVKMPCPRSRCSRPVTFTAEDGTEMQTWYSIRRENLQNMRRMVKRVVLYMALIEAIRVGPDAIIWAGTKGYPERGPEDFGIAYYAGYILSYIYLCIFSVVWKPLFSWWVAPTPASEPPKSLDKVARFLQQVNMVLLPLSIALSLGEYVFWALSTIIYVDARPVDSFKMPKNTQKNWLARLMLLVGVFVSITLGYGMFDVLAENDLAHVKTLEYMVIVVPIQINLGVLFGSGMQWRMEKRIERKKMAAKVLEAGTVDEKEALLVV